MTAAQLLAMRQAQALAIITNLSAWAAERTGRGFSVVNTADGYKATLIEVERRSTSGSSMTDALAQLASVAGFELVIEQQEAVAS